jgi:hypothetical protein
MAKRGPKSSSPKAVPGKKVVSDPARVLPAPQADAKTDKERMEDRIARAVTPEGRAMVRLTGEEAPRHNPSTRMIEPAEGGGMRFAQVPELIQTNPATRAVGPGIKRSDHLRSGAENARNSLAHDIRREEDTYMYERLLQNMMTQPGAIKPLHGLHMSERHNSGMIPPPGRGISDVKTWTDESIVMSDEEKKAIVQKKKQEPERE